MILHHIILLWYHENCDKSGTCCFGSDKHLPSASTCLVQRHRDWRSRPRAMTLLGVLADYSHQTVHQIHKTSHCRVFQSQWPCDCYIWTQWHSFLRNPLCYIKLMQAQYDCPFYHNITIYVWNWHNKYASHIKLYWLPCKYNENHKQVAPINADVYIHMYSYNAIYRPDNFLCS